MTSRFAPLTEQDIEKIVEDKDHFLFVECIVKQLLDSVYVISRIIIKITISSIMISLKNSYFPLTHLPSCYRTVQQTNQIQSCSLNQPIKFKVVV